MILFKYTESLTDPSSLLKNENVNFFKKKKVPEGLLWFYTTPNNYKAFHKCKKLERTFRLSGT